MSVLRYCLSGNLFHYSLQAMKPVCTCLKQVPNLFSGGEEVRARDLYLACVGRKMKEGFEHSAIYHRHLNLWNGCSHSETSFKTNTH